MPETRRAKDPELEEMKREVALAIEGIKREARAIIHRHRSLEDVGTQAHCIEILSITDRIEKILTEFEKLGSPS